VAFVCSLPMRDAPLARPRVCRPSAAPSSRLPSPPARGCFA
jgi:hypothetical protein